MPIFLASFDRATTQPSLLDSTTTGRPSSCGWKALSHETKKLLQSTRAYTALFYFLDYVGDHAPDGEVIAFRDVDGLVFGISGKQPEVIAAKDIV